MQRGEPVGRVALLAGLLVFVMGTLLLVITWVYWGPRWTPPINVGATNPAAADRAEIELEAIPLNIPPLQNPPAVHADQAGLPDNEIVLGVVLEGQARAYQRAALANMHAHVVEDAIGTRTIIVTHCSRNLCTRVFIADPGDSPDVRLGGWRADQSMELIVGTQRFSQQSRDIPLAEFSFEEVTWAEWRRRHPDTSVLRMQPRSPQVRS
jgi:Protein of unknown function (DUF3179)